MYSEADLLPLSALQHVVFCERQAALIHVEGLWQENALTIQGHHLHARVDGAGRPRERRPGRLVTRSLSIRSFRLGVVGRADVVEFSDVAGQEQADVGAASRICPVEYKRGKPKRNACDRVQLCAQAICLEEMLGCPVPAGDLFYARIKKRVNVSFDEALRTLTERTARRLHELVANRTTPVAKPFAGCQRCSLAALCLPEVIARDVSMAYLEGFLLTVAE